MRRPLSYMAFQPITDKKENKFFPIYKEIQKRAIAKSYMTKFLRISSYICIFATAPSEFPYIRGKLYLIFFQWSILNSLINEEFLFSVKNLREKLHVRITLIYNGDRINKICSAKVCQPKKIEINGREGPWLTCNLPPFCEAPSGQRLAWRTLTSAHHQSWNGFFLFFKWVRLGSEHWGHWVTLWVRCTVGLYTTRQEKFTK